MFTDAFTEFSSDDDEDDADGGGFFRGTDAGADAGIDVGMGADDAILSVADSKDLELFDDTEEEDEDEADDDVLSRAQSLMSIGLSRDMMDGMYLCYVSQER